METLPVTESIKQFFATYQVDFEKLDLILVPSYYALPCHMSMIGRVKALNSNEEFQLEFQPMFEALIQAGFDHAKYRKRSFSKLNSDLTMVSFQWEFYTIDDVKFSEFAAIYNLKNINDEWKIISVILHNIHKYVELAESF